MSKTSVIDYVTLLSRFDVQLAMAVYGNAYVVVDGDVRVSGIRPKHKLPLTNWLGPNTHENTDDEHELRDVHDL